MVQKKLNELRPYVTGIRFVKDLPVVDVILRDGWDMFETDTVVYKPSSGNQNYFMVYPKNPEDSLDIVLDHVEHIIDFNVEKENKLTLLKAKVEELKLLFTDKPLKDLEKLKFVVETISSPTLSDLPSNPKKVINGVELPPTEKTNQIEKEEEGV